MSKIKWKVHLDDYQAQETSVYLTALIYTRLGNVSRFKWRMLMTRNKFLKDKLLDDLDIDISDANS